MHQLARVLVSMATLATLIGSNLADWNDTHLFSEQWSAHARFHGAWMVFAFSLLSLYCLYLVWWRSDEPARTRIAAIMQTCIWVAFFLALLVPGGALADPGKSFGRITGVEVNFYGALVQLLLLVLGFVLIAKHVRRDVTAHK